MLKTDTRVIDGATFSVTQLPAMRSLKLFARAGTILGPALTKLAPLTSGGGGLMNADIGALGGVLEVLFAKLSDVELEYLTTELLWSLLKDGKQCRVGKEFEVEVSSVLTIIALLRFAFEVNFGDFFDAVRGMLKKVPAPSPSPAPSA